MDTLLRLRRYLGILIVTSLCFATSAGAQLSEREVDARITGLAMAVNKVELKKVLVADAVTLGRYIRANDTVLAGYAIDQAARRRDRELIPSLAARLGDRRNVKLSVAASRSLGALRGEEARLALRRGILDTRVDVRTSAAVSLGSFHDRAAIPVLRECLDRPDSSQRIAAASYLSIFRDMQSIPRIVRMTREVNSLERRRLCSALARFGDQASERRLRQMVVQESYSGTRARAAMALGVPANRSAVRTLILALRDSSPTVRWAAAQALQAIGDRRAIPPLLRSASEVSLEAGNSPRMEAAAHAAERQAAAKLAQVREGSSNTPYHPITQFGIWERTHAEARSVRPGRIRSMPGREN
jgi:HEAT repeat protein